MFVLSLQALGDLSGQEVPEEIASQALNKLTDGTLSAYAPTWANSTRLVYMANATDSGGGVDLRVIAINGTQTAVTGDGPDPDRKSPGRLAGWRARGLRRLRAGHARRYRHLHRGDGWRRFLADGGHTLLRVRPRWSPDGRYLVYSSNRTGNWEIYIVDVQDYGNYQVTVNNDFDEANAWLP